LSGGSQNNQIGGAVAGAGNVIAASLYQGIYIADPGTSGNVIQGNLVGIGTDGATALGNGFEALAVLNSASGNLIGGLSPAARNILSANGARAFI